MLAMESFGLVPDGRFNALNSYENRVYQLGLESGGHVVAKFYRPGRWSDGAILEEHAFASELVNCEIPVVAPLPGPNGETLSHFEGFRFAVYPRRGGHWPELENEEVLLRLGRFLGRMHAVGSVRPFAHRPVLDRESFGDRPARFLLDGGLIPPEYRGRYEALTTELLKGVTHAYEQSPGLRLLRLHGDFHPGNILWSDTSGASLVDLDDARMGPAIQDLWMLLSGDRTQMGIQLSILLEGYEEFHDFNRRELRLVEALRALRYIHYSAWLAERWDDPAFPMAFPWFNTPKYWEEHLVLLSEQIWRLDEEPLKV
jgi:Ser/Thr protein kinase RdoA (MazF antagonist)